MKARFRAAMSASSSEDEYFTANEFEEEPSLTFTKAKKEECAKFFVDKGFRACSAKQLKKIFKEKFPNANAANMDAEYYRTLITNAKYIRTFICRNFGSELNKTEIGIRKKKFAEPPFNFIIAIDFECICEKNERYEVIEFPAILIDVKERKIVAEFHEYVKPKELKLNDFTTELTGITQDKLDSAKNFLTVLTEFSHWIKKHVGKKTFAIATDGVTDFGKFFQETLAYYNSNEVPYVFRKFIDVKTLVMAIDNIYHKFDSMLQILQVELEGRHHSGLDDARNLARAIICLLQDYHIVFETHQLIHKDVFKGRRIPWNTVCSKVHPYKRFDFVRKRTYDYQLILLPKNVKNRCQSSTREFNQCLAKITNEFANVTVTDQSRSDSCQSK